MSVLRETNLKELAAIVSAGLITLAPLVPYAM